MTDIKTNKRRILRTLRCKNRNIVGTLANLISEISSTGAGVGMIKTVAMGEMNNIRDISIQAEDLDHLKVIVQKVNELPNVELMLVADEVLELHKGGKIKVTPTYPITNLDDLKKVYTPGVAEVCVLIKKNQEEALNYTSINKNVAIVTNGSRVLGLGNMGPVASMPVMEGKAALFSQFTGMNMIPILVKSREPKVIVDTVEQIASGFSVIQLEDIEAPACFEVEDELKKRLEIPVIHDDQHGTATVVLAAAINACRLSGKDFKTLKVGQVGLGAAGLAIANLVSHYIQKPVYGTDLSEEAKARFSSHGGIVSDLPTIMKECDMVIATTGRKGLIKPEQVSKGQIILALSNPYPEISIHDAREAGAAFAADGTRVNNLLGYPGLIKGAISVRATDFTKEMFVAAAEAIADFAPDRELVPDAIDPKLHDIVTHAVAKAACDCGVAKKSSEEYYLNEQESQS